MAAEVREPPVVRLQLVLPRAGIDARQLRELRARELVEAFKVEVLEARHDAEGRLHAAPAAEAALDYPLQHAHVLAEPGPDELAFFVAAEPVDAEDSRRLLHRAAHLQPVVEVVAHVVAAEV